jgi:hypothetical protein
MVLVVLRVIVITHKEDNQSNHKPCLVLLICKQRNGCEFYCEEGKECLAITIKVHNSSGSGVGW